MEKQEKDYTASNDAANLNSNGVFTLLERVRKIQDQHPNWFAPKGTTPKD